MTATPRPHDLLWLNRRDALQGIDAPWVSEQWRSHLLVVVRRDVSDSGLIPVGVRGVKREQRAAGWVSAQDIVRVARPNRSPVSARCCARRLFHSSRCRRLSSWPSGNGRGRGALPALPALRSRQKCRCCMRQAIWTLRFARLNAWSLTRSLTGSASSHSCRAAPIPRSKRRSARFR